MHLITSPKEIRIEQWHTISDTPGHVHLRHTPRDLRRTRTGSAPLNMNPLMRRTKGHSEPWRCPRCCFFQDLSPQLGGEVAVGSLWGRGSATV